ATGRNLFQKAAHDLARTSFWQSLGKADVIGFGHWTDFLSDVLPQFLAQVSIGLHIAFQSDKGHEGLTLQIIWTANYSRFGDLLMAHEFALDFGGADPMTGDIENVVDPTHNPKVTILVLPAAISGEVTALDFAPIHRLVALRIAPQATEHARP